MNQMVRVFDTKLEVKTIGEHGRPIVIMTGMGCSFEEWIEVTERLVSSNRILLYHRPGTGRSEISTRKRNTEATAKELKELLHVLQIDEPIVLIGHSYGGLCAQHYAKLFPGDLAALILIDSTSHDLHKLDALDTPVMDRLASDEDWIQQCRHYAKCSTSELTDLIGPNLSEAQQKLPESIQAKLLNFSRRPQLYKTMLEEVQNWYQDAKLIKDLGSFEDVPLYILSRDAEYEIKRGRMEGLPESELKSFEGTWHQLVREQAELSSNSRFFIAKGASHAIHLDRPDMILDVVNASLNN
ncbi:alpha/beta hydrolase [Exiguobacterium sp. AB2]|uniref:alpha/beta hydrolase n=1 Tax=Exiguobacterium sp. AB2 TaxID=1484479 RepID=UPI0004A8C83E|nr:alpha/beta hydrolase [Exiguobacterium sp. AB2]KDN58954.1 hypothetical protein DI14_13860 [Exiguobacterium sp. AB2]